MDGMMVSCAAMYVAIQEGGAGVQPAELHEGGRNLRHAILCYVRRDIC